jgi:hypothetical protein
MTRLSPSDAALEGFQALRRHWRAVAGWAGFQVVAIVALLIVMFVLLIGVVPFAASRDVANSLGAVVGGLVLGVGGGVVQLVILTGLYRVMLTPEAPGFMHLRIGADELRVFGGALATVLVGVALAALAAALGWAAGHVSGLAGFLVTAGLMLATYAAVLRLGLTPVIAFAEKRISLRESWRRTRGQTWNLIGMAVLLLCLLGVAVVVVWLAVFLIGGLLTGFQDLNLTDRETLSAHPGRFVFQALVELVLAPVFLVIGQAPWVAAYKALTPAEEA